MATYPAVFLWRRVDRVSDSVQQWTEVLGGKPIGRDDYAAIFDTGNILLGLWSQEEFLSSPASTAGRNGLQPSDPTPEQTLVAENQCGGINYLTTVSNPDPTLELIFASNDLAGLEQRAGTLRLENRRARGPLGATFELADGQGNRYGFAANEPQAQTTGGMDGGGCEARLFGLRLQVGDLDHASRFYGAALGLEPAEVNSKGNAFQAGGLTISLEKEPKEGLVRSVAQTGRFNGDLLVFYTKRLKKAVSRLRDAGVRFPLGIESSVTGRMATFFDPDGRALALWKPAGEDSPGQAINFYPALHRILDSKRGRGKRH